MPELLPWPPTAVQAVAVLHDTPFRKLLTAPAGLGVGWIFQLLPFQRSASVTRVPEPLPESPTAVQAVAAVHDTPIRKLPVAPVGLGVGWIAQLLPFQRSASVR